MRLAVAASFASVAFALRPAPISRLPVTESSVTLPSCHRQSTSTALRMMADDAPAGGPFTRKSLLEGVTKGAGVLGAGTLVQKGFFAGVPYFGTPDLSGKVCEPL